MNRMFTLLKSVALIWLPMLALPYMSVAQCGTTFYDSGGPTGLYPANADESWTFCPDNPGTEVIEVTFTSFQTEINWDKLYVYDGPDNTYPQISTTNGSGSGPCTQTGGYWGVNLPGPFTATHPSGCLTFEFCSDGSVQQAGWAADVECVPAPSCFPPIINIENNPRDCDNFTFSVDIEIEQSGFPAFIPFLTATVTSGGASVPGTGGNFPNQAGTFTLTNLPLDQDLDITIQLPGTECSVTETVSEISNGCPIPLECGEPLTQSYCYANNDTLPFLYVSPNEEPVTLFFEGGLLQSCCDFISIYDGDNDETGELLYEGNNNGNLNGLGVVAESGSLFMRVNSNVSVSCTSGSTVSGEWNWIVGCGIDIEGCTDPEALNYLPVATVDNGSCLEDGQDCENAVSVDALPYSNGGNTEAFGNDYAASDVPQQIPGGALSTGVNNNNYLNGPEAVFAYTPDADGFIDISVIGSGASTGLWVFQGCPFELTAAYHNEVAGGAGRFIEAMPVFAGTDYYVVISSTNTPQPFNVTIENTVFECPELDGNIGDLCPIGDVFGLIDEECNCEEIPFDGCTDGTLQGDLVPACTGIPAAANGVAVSTYSTVLVQNGGVYTFTTGPSNNIDLFFLTVTNADGSEILAASPGQVTWQSTFDGTVRFYSNGAADCEGEVTGGASSHQRSVWVNCDNLVTDCPDLELNFGAFCLSEGEPGIVNENCECEVTVFDGCTDGEASSATLNPNCTGNVAQQGNVPIGTYNAVNVDNGAVYELGTSTNDFISAFYITITDEDGEEVLATGIDDLTWTSTLTGQVRFYTHGGADCTSPFSGSVTNHTRSIQAVDCDNLIYDCQELEQDFGELCTQDGGGIGSINEDCECGELVFPGCLNGGSFLTQNVNCNAPVSTTGSWVQEYTVVNGIENGGTYTFSTSTNASIPVFYVTISNAAGTEVLAAGAAPLTWVATGNMSVRFYTHGSPDCNGSVTGSASSHTRTTTADCSTIIPECPELGLNIGDSCDDGDPATILETVTEDCECVGIVPPAGGSCSDPALVDALPYNDSGNTSAFFNSYTADDVPPSAVNVVTTGSGSGLYLLGDDVTYAYTPASDQLIDINVTGNSIRTGLWAFSGCPFSTTVGYHTTSDAGDKAITALPVSAGVTYYIVISTWPNPQSTNYDLTITESEILPDCPGLNANFGDNCDDGDPTTIGDVVTEECECVGQPLPLTNCGEFTSTPGSAFGGSFAVPSVVSDVIEISGTEETLFNLRVAVEIDHVNTSEVQVRLISPSGTNILLMNSGNCTGGNDIEILYGDNFGPITCNSGQPALQGYFAPNGSLDALSGEDWDGEWTLQVTDIFPFQNGGEFKSWCLIPTFESDVEEFSIFEIVQDSDIHETLESAILAAGLDGVLSAPSSDLTLFAPTDDAFAALPDDLLDSLLTDPEGDLTDLLLRHVAPGTILEEDLADGQSLEVLFGENLTVTFSGGSIFVNNAEIIVSDILANNGVVHVVDAVIQDIEIETNTVVDFIQGSPDHNVLSLALAESALDVTLSGEGPFTVFAPTDDAFDLLPPGLLNDLLADPDGLLTEYLSYHASNGLFGSEDLTDGLPVQTLLGPSVTITVTEQGTIFVNDAQITVADNFTDNGVVHVINAVLDPTALPQLNVLEIIQESEVHATLETAISAAGLGSTLSGDGPFTVFAPTDDAFDLLEPGVLNSLLNDPQGALTEVLLYHVIGENLPASSLSDGQELVTLNNGQTVSVTVAGGDIFINDAQVILADQLATNGVVHFIDAVLLPEFEEPGLPTIFEIIQDSPDHTNAEQAILAAGLDGVLSNDGPFTVFAPTDAAFAQLPDGLFEALLDEPEGELTDILYYHIANGELLAADLEDGQVIETLLAGESVTVTVNSEGDVFINDAQVILADLEASNGVVHVIDAVLVPEEEPVLPTIFEIVQESEIHETLETAILAAELDGALSEPGALTLFAPTDAAFDALEPGVLSSLLADPTGALADVLLYHVVNGANFEADLEDGQVIQTLLADESVTVTVNSEGDVFINDAQVVLADLEASNGVVHVIDAVLIPEEEPVLPTIFEIVQESDIHETLETAILAAELDGALSEPGALTLFAPTDAAFDALEPGVLSSLLADPTGALADVLLYHVVNGANFEADLEDGQVIQTLFGQSVTVTINSEGDVFINDAQVILADLEASNGVVHVIDAVLVPDLTPPTDCEAATNITAAPTFAESEIAASMAGETPSGQAQCQNTGNVQPDQWFSFESVATVMYIRAWGLEDFDAAVEVYDACGGELLACQNTAPAGDREIVILPNTNPGQTYYFRVYHGGAGTPSNVDYTAAVAHIPFTKLREEDCGVFDYTPADIIRTELPPNQFLLANWYFEFTENEAPFNTYEILSPNGSNPNFKLEWFPQAEYGRTYSVRTRARMYQGPNWGDYGDACDIGFAATPLKTQLIASQALGFYDMCDVLEADNVPGADAYRWIFLDGFETLAINTANRFVTLSDVPGLNLGSPYAVRVRARSLGEWSTFGETRLIAMNNFVPETGVDANITPCDATYPLTQTLSAIEICAAEFYTWRFTNLTDPSQSDLLYTRNDGLRTISLSWVNGLVPGNTYAVQVRAGSGGLANDYGFSCNITIAGGSGMTEQPVVEAEGNAEADINIYPNPNMGGEMMVSVTDLSDDMHDMVIEVFDIYGKKVHSENVANSGTFMNTAVNFQKPLAAGIYTVNILSNDKVIGARKLVVQK